jgi:hypothetical protein
VFLVLVFVVLFAVLFVLSRLPGLGWGALLLIIPPAVYAWVSLAVVFAVMVLDDGGALTSITRSGNLVGPRWWRTFVVLVLSQLLFAVLVLAAVWSVSWGLERFGDTFAGARAVAVIGVVLDGLTRVFVAPLLAAVRVVLYYDLRAREAFPAYRPGSSPDIPQAIIDVRDERRRRKRDRPVPGRRPQIRVAGKRLQVHGRQSMGDSRRCRGSAGAEAHLVMIT